MKSIFFIGLIAMFLFACEQGDSEQVASEQVDSVQSETVEVKVIKKQQIVSKVEGNPKYVFNIVPEKMTVQQKKERFKSLLVPAAKRVYLDLKKQHDEVRALIESGAGDERIELLKIKYKAVSDKDLLARLKPHPVSIVLAQAAMESAWATSRFFTEAKNVFGVWSFNKDEPRIAAGEQRGDKTIWLKKYNTIENSIRDNYRVLARGSAYDKFRKLRLITDNPHELVKGLDKYSEIGSEYGKELSSMIRYNKFALFDKELSEITNE